jgi:hypothetical protein
MIEDMSPVKCTMIYGTEIAIESERISVNGCARKLKIRNMIIVGGVQCGMYPSKKSTNM